MYNSPRPKKSKLFKTKVENNAIKDKKSEENIIKSVESLFRLRKENKISSIRIFVKSDRSSRPDVFCKKGVLKKFAKFTGKHL